LSRAPFNRDVHIAADKLGKVTRGASAPTEQCGVLAPLLEQPVLLAGNRTPGLVSLKRRRDTAIIALMLSTGLCVT
jgi:hypothetical protein